MIELIKVSKYYPTKLGPHYVFRDVSLRLPPNQNIGVIGPNGSGKSTFLRLLAGVDVPSSGEIMREGRISWPMGLTAGLQLTLTGRENARFACRVYGMNPSRIGAQLDKIKDISGIGKYFDLPVMSYSAGMKQRVGFAITIAMDFDYYIFDEISAGGDLAFAAMAQAMMRDRLAHSRFVLASHSLPEIRRLCQAGILIRNGTLTYFDKVEDAIKAYSTAPAEVVEKTPESLLKGQRLKQQYINLKLQEQRQEKMLAVFKDTGHRDEIEKRLQNTRDHLLALSFELRTLREEPPKPQDWEGLAIELDPVARTSPYAHKIFLLQRKIEQLRIDETRQELNANKAEGRRKKKDFLERLKVTRHNLAAAQHELQEQQARAAAEARQPATQTPAAIAKSAAVPQTMAAAPAAPSNRQ